MKLLKTKINGPKIIKTQIFKDTRGFLKEVYRKNILQNIDFPFDVMSFSKKNVLRGLHIQTTRSQAKIITVTHGKIFDVAVDLRKKSKTFGKAFSIILSEKNCKGIYIPPGFAHGFQALDKENIVCYSCTEYRSVGNEHAIRYNDPQLKIKWFNSKPIMTKKDRNAKTLNEFIQNKIVKS